MKYRVGNMASGFIAENICPAPFVSATLAMPAPAYPPSNAWLELVGNPNHQVMRSQTMAPSKPARIT